MQVSTLALQMAQANISIDCAKSLGVLPFLCFIKTKLETQFKEDRFTAQSNRVSVLLKRKSRYQAIQQEVNSFIASLIDQVKTYNSLEIFYEMDQALRNNTVMDAFTNSFGTRLQEMEWHLKDLLEEQRSSFCDRIMELQSVALINTCACQMDLDQVPSHQKLRELISRLERLQLKLESNGELLEKSIHGENRVVA